MMKAIVCVDNNWSIGKDGNLLFHIKDDMNYFKAMTVGKTIICGRKTLESFPKKHPLVYRKNIVLSNRFASSFTNQEFNTEKCEYDGYFSIDQSLDPDVNKFIINMQIAAKNNKEILEGTMLFWVNSKESAINLAKIIGSLEDTIICGGEQIYNLFLDCCDTVYVTKVYTTVEGADAKFPNLDNDRDHWFINKKTDKYLDKKSGFEYQFIEYKRDIC